MTYLDFPWIVGPMPIVATVWSAYGYGRAISLGRGATEGGFVSAMLLPVGVISLVIQAFFSVYRLSYFSTLVLSGPVFLRRADHRDAIEQSLDRRADPIALADVTISGG